MREVLKNECNVVMADVVIYNASISLI